MERMDSLRLSDVQQRALLDALEMLAQEPKGAELRVSRRYRYLVPGGLTLELDGVTSKFLVRPRNLSTGGISFLHGNFLYPGTTCRIALQTTDHEQVMALGTVVRCRCVRGRAHEVGVQFAAPIEIENFVAEAQPEAEPEPVDGASSDWTAPVMALARELETLAQRGAPKHEVYRKVAQILKLLRDDCPAPVA